MQYLIVKHLFSDQNKKTAAIKKFFKDPLTQVYGNLALAKEYNEKNNNFDISEWFLLDTPKQYKTILKLLEKKEERFINSKELALIRSLPTCIKTHPTFKNRQLSRDYEWHENIQHIVEPIKDNSAILIIFN